MPAARAALSSEPATERSIFVPPDNVIDAFESGADDSVVKSFRAPELGARIFSRLRRARMAPVHS
jgi:two-component system phosphate regulon response regulator PhoB